MICDSCGKALIISEINKSNKSLYWIIIGVVFLLFTGLFIKFIIPQFYQPITLAQEEKIPSKKSKTISSLEFDDYDRIIERGLLRMGALENAEPFYFVKDGIQSGFNYEFLQLLVKNSTFSGGKSIYLNVGALADQYPKVPELLLLKNRSGDSQVDVALDGLTFSDKDLQGIVYTIPYFGENFGYGVITKKSVKLNTVKELNGKKVGILKDDPDVRHAVETLIPEALIIELDSEIFENGNRVWLKRHIENGTVDAIVYDYPFGVAEIKGTNLHFSLSKIPNSSLSYKIALRDGNPKLKELLNKAINDIKNSSEYTMLEKKYFSTSQIQKIQIPANSTFHIVKNGESLSSIAKDYFGDMNRFHEIQQLNNLPNPNFIEVNQKLVLPAQ